MIQAASLLGLPLVLAMAAVGSEGRSFALTPTPAPEELLVLHDLAVSMQPRWMAPQYTVDAGAEGATVYRVTNPMMAGAVEQGEITRYPSAAAAAGVFGTGTETYRGLPARASSAAGYTSSHFQHERRLSWLYNTRIFTVVTQINSTYCQRALNPQQIADPLYVAGQAHGMLPPAPFGGPGVFLSVNGIPCQTDQPTVTVTGSASPYANVFVRSPVGEAFSWAGNGTFAATVRLAPGQGNHLSVTAIDDYPPFRAVTTTTDNTDQLLLIWCLAPLDTDGDLVPDALESADPHADQTNVFLSDSDGDSLSDGTEDANRNGRPDPGETRSRAWDTDGDQLSDGVERLACMDSDPLDPDSPASFVDDDQDRLPDDCDPDDLDFDGDSDNDRFADAYEGGCHVAGPGEPLIRPGLGDVNDDSVVSNADALAVQAFFLRLIAYSSLPALGQSDANLDGLITNVDALALQAFFLSLLPLLPLQ